MEDLTVQKVNKWLFWLMILSFTVVTYLNFQLFFHGVIQVVLSLPFWFLLTLAVGGAFLIIRLISCGELAIRRLERDLQEQKESLRMLERKYRLIKQDMKQITPEGFTYYCADLLKFLGYKNVQVLKERAFEKRGVEIEAVDLEGDAIYVKCCPTAVMDEHKQISQLHYEMVRMGVTKGLILTDSDFSSGTIEWAANYQIEHLNGKTIYRLIHGNNEKVNRNSDI